MLLLADMIKSRTHTKLLRRLGITLIFLPELITTPFGVALVLISRYLSRRREASLNNRLRETVKYYLAHTRLFSDDADGESSAPGLVKRYTQSEERLIPQQYPGSRSLAIDTQSHSQHSGMRDGWKVGSGDTHREVISGSTEKVIHHTIDWESLSWRYGGQSSVLAYSNWACTSGAIEGVVQHSVNMGLLSQRYKTGSIGQVQVKYHTINMALLRQHYGATR